MGVLIWKLIIIFSVAVITYNVIISANAPLKRDFPGKVDSLVVDPIIKMPIDKTSKSRLFHTAVTSSDSVYNTWQCRVMYYWFKKMRDDGGRGDMGGFTRILHDGKPDQFMDEIPTFVANPLPDGMDQVTLVKMVNEATTSLPNWGS